MRGFSSSVTLSFAGAANLSGGTKLHDPEPDAALCAGVSCGFNYEFHGDGTEFELKLLSLGILHRLGQFCPFRL